MTEHYRRKHRTKQSVPNRTEGLPPLAMVAVGEEVVGFLRRLVVAVEKGVMVLEATEERYQMMEELGGELKEDIEEDTEEEVEEVKGAETETKMAMEVMEEGAEKKTETEEIIEEMQEK